MLNHQTLILLCDPHMWTLTTKKLGQQRIYIYIYTIYTQSYTYYIYIYVYIYIHYYVIILYIQFQYVTPLISQRHRKQRPNFSFHSFPGAIILDVADRQIRDPGEVVLQTSGFEALGEWPMGNGIRNYRYKCYYRTIDIIYICTYIYIYTYHIYNVYI